VWQATVVSLSLKILGDGGRVEVLSTDDHHLLIALSVQLGASCMKAVSRLWGSSTACVHLHHLRLVFFKRTDYFCRLWQKLVLSYAITVIGICIKYFVTLVNKYCHQTDRWHYHGLCVFPCQIFKGCGKIIKSMFLDLTPCQTCVYSLWQSVMDCWHTVYKKSTVEKHKPLRRAADK